MGFNIHRTLSLDLFSHGMVQCVPVVSLLAQKLQRIMFFWTWALGTIGKSNIFLLWKLENCSLNTDRKTPWFIFLFIKTPLVKYLSFLKKPGYLPLLSGKSSDSTVSPSQSNNRYGSRHSQTLSLDLFSHGMVQCVLGVSLHSFGSAGRHVFVNLQIGAWWQNQYLSPVKAG